MAPRGRPRKVGLRRMDAAIDAMRPLGFSKELVKRTVSNLLEVYEGDAGWVFIEEASYKLLIDTILEEQDKDLEEARGGDDAGPSSVVSNDVEPSSIAGFSVVAGDDIGSSVAGLSGGVLDIAEPSATGLQLPCPKLAGMVTTLQMNDTVGKDLLPPVEGEGSGWRDIVQDNNYGPKQINTKIRNTDENSGAYSIYQSPLCAISPELNNLPKQRRRRCHGWINNDDNDDGDLVFEERAETPKQVDSTSGQTERQRKRGKSRWDVTPTDLWKKWFPQM